MKLFVNRFFVLLIILVLCNPTTSVCAASEGLGPKIIEGGKCDFVWPVPDYYALSSCFYDQRGHYALDIYTGTTRAKVVAAYDGTVAQVVKNGNGDGGYGNLVLIKHNYQTAANKRITLYSFYGHLASFSVKKGDSVKKGQVIAYTGGTGKNPPYPIHLDFQILTSFNWKKRQDYSIDPYSNFLLELPPSIHKGGTTPCCERYINKVKNLYDYIDNQCTFYRSSGTIIINSTTTIKSLPCSQTTHGLSRDVCSATRKERYSVIGLYKNSYGNFWYKIGSRVDSSNRPISASAGYIYAGNTTPVHNGWSGYYSIDGTTASTNLSDIIDPDLSGYYYLVPQCALNSCLSPENGGKKSGTNIEIYTKKSTSAQKFHLQKQSNGYYKITSTSSGLALDVSGGIAVSGTNVQLYTPNGTSAQQWKILPCGNGYYYIISKLNSNLVLDVWNKSSKNGTNVHIWYKNGSSAQKWKLVE